MNGMNNLFRRCVAEMTGTFFLCFAGVAAICMDTYLRPTNDGAGLLGIALAHGLALGVGISATMAISGGNLNPAVSVALVATRHLHPVAGFFYIISQVVGGLLGGLAGRFAYSQIYPKEFLFSAYEVAKGGVPLPLEADITWTTAAALEAIGTFLLVAAVYGTVIDSKAPKIGGFGVGLTLTFVILAIGELTGGCVNPARFVGPALATYQTDVWDTVWPEVKIYLIGPFAGGLMAGLFWKAFLLTKPETT
jgi:MIP family channel proteins